MPSPGLRAVEGPAACGIASIDWSRWAGGTLRLVQRIFMRSYVKHQKAYRVDLGGASVKRLVLVDSFRAAELAANLRSFEQSALVPSVVSSFENEVWIEFFEGQGEPRQASRALPPRRGKERPITRRRTLEIRIATVLGLRMRYGAAERSASS